MLCSACTKLAILTANRRCVRCQNVIRNNMAVICDSCSSGEKLCAICLRKLVEQAASIKPKSNCGCGK